MSTANNGNDDHSFTGRSPYPTRNRRRQQLLLQQQAEEQVDDASPFHESPMMEAATSSATSNFPSFSGTATPSPFSGNTGGAMATGTATTPHPLQPSASASTTPTSGYMMGQGLVQARISPMNPASAAQRRKFFASTIPSTRRSTESARTINNSNGSGDVHGTTNTISTNAPSSSSASASSTPSDLILDDINITHLRSLTQSCLGHGGGLVFTAPSPSMAVFLASIVYSKTNDWHDAFVYAQAFIQNGQPKRAFQWIEQIGLLQCFSHHDPIGDNTKLAALQLEAVLLASTALATFNDWNALVTLLEDPTPYASVLKANNMMFSYQGTMAYDDDDEIAWQQLALGISQVLQETCKGNSVNATIHPLARICSLRARAYSELGHPLRAAIYWKKALSIDPLCTEALEGLLDKSVVQPTVALDTVLNMDFGGSSSCSKSAGTTPNLAWLRALYLARVHVAAPSGCMVQEGSAAATALATSLSMDHGNSPALARHGDQLNIDADENHDEENEPMDSNAAVPPPSSNQQQHHTQMGQNRQSVGSFASVMGGGDPLWQDSSMLTPIPQQPSVADMSAVSSGLFFGNATGRHSHGFTQQERNGNPVESFSPANPVIFRKSSNPAMAQAESALDALWNKHKLQHSPEVLAMAAQQAFSKYHWKIALRYCQELRKIDPLSQNSNKAAFCHVSTLVQLGQKRSLFRLAHEWVDAAPKEARSWFAVGAYYYACQRYHVAQRHFCRATRLDPQCAEAWIAFGASFAACDESDQALASFRAAQRLAPGNHVSLLYIGMEYLRTNHLVLAHHFLLAAHDSCNGTDALAKSELGVLNMAQKKHDHAISWFLQALGADVEFLKESSRHHPKNLVDIESLASLVDGIQDDYWEPTVFNLAHAYRKERFFEHAIICLERCLALKESSGAYSAMAFCLHLQSMTTPDTRREEANAILHQAIDTYHQSLAKKPDAAFSSEMLAKALGDALEQTNFFFSDQENEASVEKVYSKDVSFGSQPGHAKSRGLADLSSIWTDEGLSLSVENVSDVDMT